MNRKAYFMKTRNQRRKKYRSRRASKRSRRFFTRKQRGGNGTSYKGLGSVFGLNPEQNSLVPRSREGVSGLEEKVRELEENV